MRTLRLPATITHDRSFPWYHKAPDTGATVLTLFGQVHIALDELITEAAVRHCAGQEAPLSGQMDDRQAQVTNAASMHIALFKSKC